MGRALFSSLLRLDGLLVASASKLLLPPIPTQVEDGAFAGVRHSAPTPAPEYYASAELLRRQDYDMGHDTCGFGALDSAITYKCYSSIGTCENIGDYRGCCTDGLKACSSTFWTQCDDYDPTSVCGTMSHTRCCQSALPYCITWLLSTSDSTFTAWDCDSQGRSRTFELLATPLSLISSTSAASSTTDDISTSTSSLKMSESTSLLLATSDSATASSTAVITSPAITSPAGDDSAPTSNSSATPVGAIVGGVVGGVAVIALIVLGVLFLKRYQQKNPKTPAPPPTPPGPQELLGSGIPPSNLPPPQGSYAPIPQYDFTGRPKYQEPMVQTSPVEAPNTPAAGTGYNRAELA
ncbi:hypothetical protein F4820DRAFT_273212 [Hypoxylon rubiginosum]|uniref:Uncharacterized protein n=1 Tax=Hypoxylon rubiginosum TaxID=110542 RepID=A0ACB9Z3U0_9PEZI|nr:hypothetical protein F4820DRAFT_273212 [Hypoxylon rubiginosum]